MYKKIAIFSASCIIIDQIIKAIVASLISLNTEIKIISDFFYLTNAHNDGGAWSLFSGNVFMLIVVGFLALFFVYFAFVKGKKLAKFEILVVILLIGGIIGNLIDRIFLGYVIDYLGFIFFGYYFPIFNFADICIVVSVSLMLMMTIKEEIICRRSSSKKALMKE